MNMKIKHLNKHKVLFGLILITSIFLFSSCPCYYECAPTRQRRVPKIRTSELLEYYSYPIQPIKAKEQVIGEKKKYVIKRIEFPSAKNVFGTSEIKIDYYVQKKEGKYPTVLILPIAGGADFSVKSFAGYFACRKFNCAIVHNRKARPSDAKSAKDVENFFRQSVLDNRQVLDFLVERQEVDTDRLGCLGLSLGGIKASLLAAVDERIKCGVFGLTGGSIADIALSSQEKSIKAYSEEIIERDVSSEDIYTELSQKVKTDPIKLAEYIDATEVLMFIARFDRVIPRKCCDRLYNALGKPEAIYLFSGHYTSFLYLPYAEVKSLNFFKKKFGVK
jgi:dienelactone hydrolase